MTTLISNVQTIKHSQPLFLLL